MKRTLARFVLPLALLSVTALAQTGAAAPTPAAGPAPAATGGPSPTRVGIIYIQNAILLTNEGKRDFDTLEKKFAPVRDDLQNRQKEVDDLKKQLSTQGDKLNDEAKNKLAKDIDTKQKSLQRSLEDAQQDFQQQQGEIVNRIGQKLMDVIDKYAKQGGYAAILDVSNPNTPVIWAAANTDVTQDIAQAYNAQSNVPAPAAGAPSAPSATRPATTSSSRPPVTTPKTTPK